MDGSLLRMSSLLTLVSLGARQPGFRTANPQQMREIVIQDVCRSHHGSQIAAI